MIGARWRWLTVVAAVGLLTVVASAGYLQVSSVAETFSIQSTSSSLVSPATASSRLTRGGFWTLLVECVLAFTRPAEAGLKPDTT